jgi:hypothetical protein
MFRRYYNLVLMAIWFAIAILLIVPDWVLPEKAAEKLGGPQSVLAGCLALVFVVYNGVRWYSYRILYRDRVKEIPFQVRTISENAPAYENNPELDFFKPVDTEPSANGDHKS